ncbi:hypothetical protein [Burkholderia gladioli]|uniref:hypothetical protein n=1 Tax=Burkholderia gladioli TaxID=28095 RepID=UPI001640F6D2|nr:hypothetical protein [Burkholderia gladioli]
MVFGIAKSGVLEADWNVVRGALTLSVRLPACGSWACALQRRISMRSDYLKSCIDALNALRQDKHQELSTRVNEELKAVVEDLEHCLQDRDDEVEVPRHLRMRALELIVQALGIVSNLATLIHQFFNPS